VGLSSNLKTVALSRLTRRQFLLFSPPDFTGQNKTIVLQGDAVITRIDQENEGVAVEFINALRGLSVLTYQTYCKNQITELPTSSSVSSTYP
jgi:hypothetical protein